MVKFRKRSKFNRLYKQIMLLRNKKFLYMAIKHFNINIDKYTKRVKKSILSRLVFDAIQEDIIRNG